MLKSKIFFKNGALIIMCLIVAQLINSCSINNQVGVGEKIDSLYRIKKIRYINDWNIIYATKGDSIFKIVSKKSSANVSQYTQVVKGGYYKLTLYSRKNSPPEFDGVKISPMNYLDVGCYTYDDKTKICIEPKKGIYDLHSVSNIVGLYYIK